jgi:hypothetical protein
MVAQSRLVTFNTDKVDHLESESFRIIEKTATAERSVTAQALAAAYAKGVERKPADRQPSFAIAAHQASREQPVGRASCDL